MAEYGVQGQDKVKLFMETGRGEEGRGGGRGEGGRKVGDKI